MFGGESFGKKLHRYCNNKYFTNNCSILLSGESFGKTLHRYCNNQKFEKQLQHNVVLGEVLERSYRYCNNKQLQHNVVVGEVLKRNYMLPVLPYQHNVVLGEAFGKEVYCNNYNKFDKQLQNRQSCSSY